MKSRAVKNEIPSRPLSIHSDHVHQKRFDIFEHTAVFFLKQGKKFAEQLADFRC